MSTQLLPLNMSLPIGSLEAYVQRVNQIPMLSAEQEQSLAINLQENNDLEAAQQLILPHLRYVVRVARGYAGYGLPQADLIQEGNIGLMKAVKRFDPSLGVRLVSFAVHWIKAEIHDYVLRNWRIVKVATTKAQRKLFFKLRSAKKRLGWCTKEEISSVANDLGVTPRDVVEMEARLNAHDTPFDPVDATHDDSQRLPAPAEYLDSPHAGPAELFEAGRDQSQQQATLHTALATLDPRSQDILAKRWLTDDKATLQELAATYQISAERVRQLESNAIKKLKSAFSAPAA